MRHRTVEDSGRALELKSLCLATMFSGREAALLLAVGLTVKPS